MRVPLVRVFSFFVLTVLLGATVAYGQGTTLTAKVDFSFGVPGKTLPAGEYTVSYASANPSLLLIRNNKVPKEEAAVAFLTRLARLVEPARAHLVFDKVGEKYVLSEIWFPSEDGFLLMSTAEKHSHALVKVSK